MMMMTAGGTAMVRRAPFLVNAALSCCCFHSSLQVPGSRSDGGDPVAAAISPEMLQSRLHDAGVSKICFMRHGKTAPAENGIDFDRLLTDEGRKQAIDSGRIMGPHLLPFYPRCLVSPAPRAMETAQLFLQQAAATNSSSGPDSIELHPIPTLYDGTMQPEGSRLFRQLGYAPLRDYLDHSDTNDRNVARTVLGDYAFSVAQNLLTEVEPQHDDDDDCGSSSSSSPSKDQRDGTTLCIVGHAIYLPAAALGVASLVGCCDDPASEEVILSMNTGEAEGYLLNLDSRNVTYLSRD